VQPSFHSPSFGCCSLVTRIGCGIALDHVHDAVTEFQNPGKRVIRNGGGVKKLQAFGQI
jgi:hypothetical protein